MNKTPIEYFIDYLKIHLIDHKNYLVNRPIIKIDFIEVLKKYEQEFMEKYKTMHENKVMINPPKEITELDLSVRALNSIKQSGIRTVDELFNLSSNDMLDLKFGKKTISEINEYKVILNPPTLQEEIFTLERFTPLSNSEMLEDIEGEYVLFSSVLNLFSAKKNKK